MVIYVGTRLPWFQTYDAQFFSNFQTRATPSGAPFLTFRKFQAHFKYFHISWNTFLPTISDLLTFLWYQTFFMGL